jgi:hypothetical protein
MPAILRDTDEGAHTSNYITTTRKSAEYVMNVALVLESLKRIKKTPIPRKWPRASHQNNAKDKKPNPKHASRSSTSEKIGFNFRETHVHDG